MVDRVRSRWNGIDMDTLRGWCQKIAASAVDALADNSIVDRKQFERARDLVAEEILIRLAMGDRPPD